MVDYPYPRPGVTPMQVIVVCFVVSTLTISFWKGVGWIMGVG